MALACAALVPLVAAPEAPARSCKKLKEQRGCRLPATFGFTAPGNVFTVTGGKAGVDANGRFMTSCTGGGEAPLQQEAEWPIDSKLDFPPRPRVGKGYDVESITENPPDSTNKVAKYVWAGRLRIRSAKKAALTLSFTSTYGSNEADTRTCTGSVTKTPTRVKYL